MRASKLKHKVLEIKIKGKKGMVLDSFGWIVLGIITILVIMLLIFVFRKPMQQLTQIVIGALRFN